MADVSSANAPTNAPWAHRADRTYALVVGVEHYAEWLPPLPGPVNDACAFADWLRQAGVPAANIFCFLSSAPGGAGRAPKDAAIVVRPATRDAIWGAISDTLPGLTGDMLYLLWGGHGVTDAAGRRRLFYADVSLRNKTNLDVDAVLASLKSSRFDKLPRQTCIVDACSTFVETLNLKETLPHDEPPVGAPRGDELQSVIYASRPGESAFDLQSRKTGAFSEVFLEQIAAEPFPPDIARVAQNVKAVFEERRAHDKRWRLPQYRVTEFGGSQRLVVSPPENDEYILPGDLVGKLYDREAQDGAFCSAFPDALRHGSCLSVIVYGDKHEAHLGYLDRLTRWRLPTLSASPSDAFTGIGEFKDAPVMLTLDGRDRDDRQRLVCRSLADVTGAPVALDSGWTMLAATRPFRDYAVVVITHHLPVAAWDEEKAAMLRWYVEEFWSTAKRQPDQPTVVLLISIECDAALSDRSMRERMLGRDAGKARLVESLAALREERQPYLLLEELRPLELLHVEAWFYRYVRRAASLDDAECLDRAKQVYQSVERRKPNYPRTDQIQRELIKVHRELVQREVSP
ncbi:MAG: caspase family protein [Gemmatimonadaceae bacterium]